MKWAGWILGIGAFLVMLYACALPGDFAVGRDISDGLAGTYTVNGIDPTGLEYSGTVVIATTDRADTYAIEWIITGSILRGTGVHTGNEFVAEWTAVSSVGGGSGTSIYTVESDGRLIGTRQVDGFDTVGPEEIFPEA